MAHWLSVSVLPLKKYGLMKGKKKKRKGEQGVEGNIKKNNRDINRKRGQQKWRGTNERN